MSTFLTSFASYASEKTPYEDLDTQKAYEFKTLDSTASRHQSIPLVSDETALGIIEKACATQQVTTTSSWNPFSWVLNQVEQYLGKPQNFSLGFNPGIGYWAKRWFHLKAHIQMFKTTAKMVEQIDPPQDTNLGIASLREVAKLPVDNVYTAETLPTEEKSFAKDMAGWFIYQLYNHLSLYSSNVPEISQDREAMMQLSWPAEYESYLPRPKFPIELRDALKDGDVVGKLALAGPFAYYTKKIGTNLFKIDLSKYEDPFLAEVKPGLMPLGTVSYMTYDSKDQYLHTHEIEYLGRKYTPKSPQWKMIQKVAMATLAFETTVIRHALQTHFLNSGDISAVNNDALSVHHPLRLLMYPHQRGTLSQNKGAGPVLIGGDEQLFPALFSYDLNNLLKVWAKEIKNFDFNFMDVYANAKERGMMDRCGNIVPGIQYPTLENTKALYDIIHTYVGKWIDVHYKNEQAVKENAELSRWYNELVKYIPPVEKYMNGLNKDSLKKFTTLFMYTASVQHYYAGASIFHYNCWFQYIPLNVKRNGTLPTIAEHQTYMNTNLGAFGPAVSLTTDFSNMALQAGQQEIAAAKKFSEEAAKAVEEKVKTRVNLMQEFTQKMQQYDAELKTKYTEENKQKGYGLHILFPSVIPTSTNA